MTKRIRSLILAMPLRATQLLKDHRSPTQYNMASQSLVRRPTDQELMPPPPTKRIKRPPKVLDEDTYTDALSKIIARDFFPGLLEARAQQEYLDALSSNDREWIASASRRLTKLMRTTTAAPIDTPRGEVGDTPASVMTTTETVTSTMSSTIKVDLDMSLGTFQAKYTSEDNESFNKLLDKHNSKRAERYAWMWAGNRIPSSRQIMQQERKRQIADAQGGDDTTSKSRLLIEASDDRKAMPDTWNAKPDNQFFFAPEGVEDEYETVQQNAESQSKAPPKVVIYDNTRLPPPRTESHSSIPPSPSLSAIRDAIAGHPRPTESEVDYPGGSTPRVNGYAFVDDEPTAAELGHASALLKSGGSGDATPNPFKIRAQSKRESLHHRIVDRVAKRNRAAARPAARVLRTPTSAFSGSPTVGGDLTPAAQSLWKSIETPSGSLGGGAFGTPSRQGPSINPRWTPTPKKRSSKKSMI